MLQILPRRALLAAFAVLAVVAPRATIAASSAAPVTVFAAASLKNALDEVGPAFTAASGTQVRISYAASPAIAHQIEQSAPADVYISADSDWMDYLQQRRLIVAASRRDLLTNHLALVAPAASNVRLRIRPGIPLAETLGSAGRLAVAGPEVPAGRYARASLQALGALDSVKDRLASAEDVRAAPLFGAPGATARGSASDTASQM